MRTKIQTPLKPVLLIAAVMCCLLFSCGNWERPENSPNCNKWQLTLRHNWADYTTVVCDSCQMLSEREAFVWTNGKKTRLYAKKIRAHYLPCNN